MVLFVGVGIERLALISGGSDHILSALLKSAPCSPGIYRWEGNIEGEGTWNLCSKVAWWTFRSLMDAKSVMR